jgi:tRNA1(Val) A37 N6-methylase TrmN6
MTEHLASDPDITDDAILNGRVHLLQPRRGHRFGHDAILLAAAVPAQAGDRVAEFGAGVGAAGLALLARVSHVDVTLYEIDPRLCTLAQENIARNGFAGQARAETQNVAALPPGTDFNHVFMNPPFNNPSLQPSPDPGRRSAHAAPDGLLADWIASARTTLRDGGTVTLIWRAEGLPEVTAALAAGFGAVTILPIYPGPRRLANRVIANAQKGGHAPLRILPPLLLNGSDLRPTADAEAILREGEALSIAQPSRTA